ncbi:BadF/BadG/BcrA/BcrD ATPase family protein [Ramlibacter tataouinensis]|nr:BadF/BadG/BcrA/BcrD ATPase family protein [Ramlibacter tataouinensis]
MQLEYRLGVDGGGTGCRVRLTDRSGNVLGEGYAGPANLALGLDSTLHSVLNAVTQALGAANLPSSALARTCAGLGLAAGNVAKLRQAFAQLSLPFGAAVIRSDAEVACLGAHNGQAGAILILGTGSQGVLHEGGRFITVGGWGFALSDAGSGAILGRETVRRAFSALEGIEPSSGLTETVINRFAHDRSAMLEWATSAQPKNWAEFAPLVFERAKQLDPVALELVRDSARSAEKMLERLKALGAQCVCLMGGLAEPIKPYLSAPYSTLLVPAQGDALHGALLLAATHKDAVRSDLIEPSRLTR